ncbi:MAG: histidine phosphatase family protein [Nitrosomonas sp.]|nr:histidine phosphatase family protein [Nitrosomonas sp.]MDP1950756.1 histidine phosphatase family protein [Nitrosomonas sp.]
MLEHKLLIMRHAKSDWSADSDTDFDRPLSTEGTKAAKLMGKWLKKNRFNPDRVICSPALRASQTCQLALKALGVAEHSVIRVAEVYDASLQDLLFIVNQHSKDIGTLLIVGHNPGLDQLLCYLSKDSPSVNASGKLLTAGALAILDYGSEAIAAKFHQAHLQRLIRPKEICCD